MTCGTCKHFRPSPNFPANGFGTCAVNAWMRSYTPGIGYGFSPTPKHERQCDAMEPRQ